MEVCFYIRKTDVVRHRIVRLTKSAYVSSCRAPTLKDQVIDGFVEGDDNEWRVAQKAVPTKSICASSEGR